MTKKTIITVLLALLTMSANSQDTEATVDSAPGWLWEISGNGLQQRSYLFGTCHGDGHNFTREEVFGITGLEASLNSVKAVLFEGGLNPKKSEADSIAIVEEVKKATGFISNPGPEWFMPEGKTYESLFDSIKHFKMVDRVLTRLAERMNDGEYSKKSPRYWCSFLILAQLTRHGKIQSSVMSVDELLKQEVQERGIDVGYVEGGTVGASVLSMFNNAIDTLSMKGQAEALYRMMEGIARQKKTFEGMTKAYLENDTCKMENFLRGEGFVPGTEDSDNSQREITLDRNVAWIPVIEQNIALRPCMVAVGCRHLLGSKSLIALLRREGYTVEPVKKK